MNARNLNWNLILCKPYCDGGPPVCNQTYPPGACALTAPQCGIPWWDISPSLRSGVYVDGELNNPRVGTKYWSIEIGIPIQEYLRYERRGKNINNGDYWRLDFSRVEWHLSVVKLPDGSEVYWKTNPEVAENWVWQPTSKVNMHLPESWGYVQFSSEKVNSTKLVRDIQWPVRQTLIQIYYAQADLYSRTQMYTVSLRVLVFYGLPDSIVLGHCSLIPSIQIDKEHGYIATAYDKYNPQVVGHIRSDRLLWFD